MGPRRSVDAVAEVAEVVGHFPDVDLRPEGVTVRTASGEYGALSERDVELARRISVEARTLQTEPKPSQVQVVGIAMAQDAGSDVGPFWAAALGAESGRAACRRHARAQLVDARFAREPRRRHRGLAGLRGLRGRRGLSRRPNPDEPELTSMNTSDAADRPSDAADALLHWPNGGRSSSTTMSS
jgi:hypothetical protein